MRSARSSAHDLVDTTNGEISREMFVSDDIYQEDKERIFTRAWLYIGHESQIRNPGDYFVTKMGEESVILTRDTEGKIHVSLNSCAHRGMKVCRYDEGNTSAFRCPYHSWTYKTDGTLIGVQDYENTYRAEDRAAEDHPRSKCALGKEPDDVLLMSLLCLELAQRTSIAEPDRRSTCNKRDTCI